jgi:predicted dinucleotide-binding enzyme
MKVGIIGTGWMGRGFAAALTSKHEVIVGSRDPGRAQETASKTGAAGGATYADAAADADMVILTVPWEAMDETLTLFELARDMGFHPVDVGPLKATRELERLVGVMLFVKLGPLRVLSR